MKEECPPSEGLGHVPGSRVWDWSSNSGWSQPLPDAWTGPPDPSPAAKSISTSCHGSKQYNILSGPQLQCMTLVAVYEQISIQLVKRATPVLPADMSHPRPLRL